MLKIVATLSVLLFVLVFYRASLETGCTDPPETLTNPSEVRYAYVVEKSRRKQFNIEMDTALWHSFKYFLCAL